MRVFSASIPAAAGLLLATAVPALADGGIRRVDVGPRGGQLGPGADGCAISANGRFVAFVFRAHVLVPGDTNRTYDVFVRDLATGRIERASVGPGGAQADGPSFCSAGALSADGRSVAFLSYATDLVPGDTNGAGCDLDSDPYRGADMFVRAR